MLSLRYRFPSLRRAFGQAFLCALWLAAAAPASAADDATVGAAVDSIRSAGDEAGGGPAAAALDTLAVLAGAWRAGDHATVARLAAAEGARIDLGGESASMRDCSPGQAFYIFKALFRGGRTMRFDPMPIATGVTGNAADAVVEWRYLRGGSEHVEHLFLSLQRGPEGWRWTEIRVRP